ncbi:MAG: nitroreductase family protein [Candidatus Thermoplasmatota archaeon]
MNRYEAIYRRKSVRKYSLESLPESELERIRRELESTAPLYDHVDSHVFLAEDGEKVQENFSGLKSKVASVESPHYLVGTSEKEEGYLVNMGYMLEDLVLFLADRELGTCWLGSGLNDGLLSEVYDFEHDLVIMVALGDSTEGESNLRSGPEEAKRKPIKELVLNDLEELPETWKDVIDAARMAPSAVNSQPWRFYYDEDGDSLHVFIEKKGLFKGVVRKIADLDKLNRIDVGIALKHLEIAAENFSLDIRFEDMGRKRKGHEYIMSAVES